jgi:segregation and condensation protein B
MSQESVSQSVPTEQRASEFALELASRIEALLFVADAPVSAQQLAQALETDENEIEAGLEQLGAHYQTRGLRLQRQNRAVQFVTAPEAAPYVERFLNLDLSSRLSTAALETLALIAYQQPITRMQIEAIRGVNCDGVLRTLLSRGLVAPQGRLDQAGRPIVYGTTFEFLQYFGLSDLSELPALEPVQSAHEGGGESNEPGREANATASEREV